MRVVISAAAQADVRRIAVTGTAEFGGPRARAYVMGLREAARALSQFPHAYRERPELRPPARVRPYGVHVILYVVETDVIRVLRIRHGREDWLSG